MQGSVAPLDGFSLVQVMHAEGINVRSVGTSLPRFFCFISLHFFTAYQIPPLDLQQVPVASFHRQRGARYLPPAPPRSALYRRITHPFLSQEKSSPAASSTQPMPPSAARPRAHSPTSLQTFSTACSLLPTSRPRRKSKTAAAATPPPRHLSLPLISGPT